MKRKMGNNFAFSKYHYFPKSGNKHALEMEEQPLQIKFKPHHMHYS